MQDLHIITTSLILLLVLYWAILIGSSLWACAVRYVSSGEKDCKSLACWIDYKDGQTYHYDRGEYKDQEVSDTYGVSLLLSLLYLLVTAIIQGLIGNGYGTIIIIILSTIATLIGTLKLSKWIYSINSKLNKHTQDKNAHS